MSRGDTWGMLGEWAVAGRGGGGPPPEIIPRASSEEACPPFSPPTEMGFGHNNAFPLPTHSCAAEWAHPLTHTWAIEEEQVPTKERTLLLPLWAG